MNNKLLLFISFNLLLSITLFSQKDSTHFVMTWRTDNPGFSNDSAILINTHSFLTYNYDVDWDDDGIFDTLGVTSDLLIQYPSPGIYTVRIRGIYPSINSLSDPDKMIAIEQWGTTIWTRLIRAFINCRNITSNATDVPDLSSVTSLDAMFLGAIFFNGNLSNWDVSNINKMRLIFGDAAQFNSDISSWNVSNLTDARNMFSGASSFNQNIGNWDVSSVLNMQGMFYDATAFDQDISNWNVSRVKNMNSMFNNATNFSHDISIWNVDSVTNMGNMFANALAFNHEIGNWNTRSLTNLSNMFNGAINFNHDIGKWNIQNVTNMNQVVDNSGLSIANYDSLLIGWQAQPHTLNLAFGGSGLDYCLGDSARTILISDGWTFSGDTLNCIMVGIDETQIENKFKVYPNPTTDYIQIESDISIDEVHIYSILGNLVKTEKSNIIDFTNLPTGQYIIEIKAGSAIERRKVVKN